MMMIRKQQCVLSNQLTLTLYYLYYFLNVLISWNLDFLKFILYGDTHNPCIIICLNSSKIITRIRGVATLVLIIFHFFLSRADVFLSNMSYTLPELCKDFKCDTCSVAHRSAAFNGSFRKIAFYPSKTCMSMEALIDECMPGIRATFEEITRKRIKCKVNFAIQVLFLKVNFNEGTVDEEDRGYMSLNAMAVQNSDNLEDVVEIANFELQEKIDSSTSKGSNWVVGAMEQLIMSLVAYN